MSPSPGCDAPPSLHRGNTPGHHRLLSNSKNIPTIRLHLQSQAIGQQQQEVTSWWRCNRAAWRLMVPQCSLLLHPPSFSPLSCEKTLITVPKAAGNTMESAQSCSCHKHKHTSIDSWTSSTHPPAPGAHRQTYTQLHIDFHVLPYYSWESISSRLFFISLARSKTFKCWCCQIVLVLWLLSACYKLIFRKQPPSAFTRY